MRRTQKFLVTCLVIGAALLLILWNTSAETAPAAVGVAEAKRKAAEHGTLPLAVRGMVVAESIVLNGTLVDTFVIADAEEQLLVELGQAPPDNFGPKDVVVNGRLRQDPDGRVVLEATSIQVGCSSKY